MKISSFRLGPLPPVALAFLMSCANPPEPPPAAADRSPAAPAPDIKAMSPLASIATMELPSGYRLEPVLTEPDIAEPVMVAFDGNGRMYVAEMRTDMMDADATGE